MGPKTIYSTISQKCIGPDMLSSIRHYGEEGGISIRRGIFKSSSWTWSCYSAGLPVRTLSSLGRSCYMLHPVKCTFCCRKDKYNTLCGEEWHGFSCTDRTEYCFRPWRTPSALGGPSFHIICQQTTRLPSRHSTWFAIFGNRQNFPSHVRHSHGERPADGNTTSGDCHVIYQLPSIRVLRLIMRLKLFQTAIVVLAVPPVCYMYSQEQLSSTNASLIVGTATFAIFMLYAMSFWLRRMIGRLSLNTTGDMVHLAHMSFWGRRKEVILPVRNLMALSAKTRRGEPLVQIRRYDSQEVFYLSLRFGRIVDKRRFEQVFGSIK